MAPSRETWDLDNDPLDIEVVEITEPLVAGCLAEVRIIGGMKFTDDGEVDDKMIGVLANDKRVEHITSDRGSRRAFQKSRRSIFGKHYKALKKPGTGVVGEFLNVKEAAEIVRESAERYEKEYKPKLAA